MDMVMLSETNGIVQILDVALDPVSHCAWQNGKMLVLTPKEYELLYFLAVNKDKAVSRDEILSTVWGYAYSGTTRTVDVHIQRLRKKLHWEKDIQTVFKYGYRLCTGTNHD